MIVGSGVSVGWGVKGSMKGKVGCGEAVFVGEGSGLIVQVGSISGSGEGWMNVVNAPHPIDKNVIARMTNVRRGNLMNGGIYTENGDCFGLTPSQHLHQHQVHM